MKNAGSVGLIAVWVLAGCVEYELPQQLPDYPPSDAPPLPQQTWEDRFLQVSSPVVDVLFTIDNSCSMEDEQGALASAFPRFISYFLGSGLDYHIGVISTDLDNPDHQGRLREAQGVRYIDVDTIEPEAVFTEMASMSTEGSGIEKGLGAVYIALEGFADTFNQGFYRDEAEIHTVVISDEDDHTESTIIAKREFIAWYDGLKREPGDRTFSSIVTMSGRARGDQYLDVTDEIGGITWNIGRGNWETVLDLLGVQASGMKREFFLSHLPAPGTIQVEVEDPTGIVLPFGEALGPDPTDGWIYDRIRNSITFVSFVPSPDSLVVIRYTLLSTEDQIEQAER